MANFVPLHVHSHYSLLDGLAKIDELVGKAKKLGIKSMALTDHGSMYGAIEFYQKCQKAGIKPIIGCEVYISPRKMTDKQPRIDAKPYHLILLAKDKTGYKNLIKLVSESHLVGFYYKPRIDKELLAKHSQGLIAMSACLHGEIPRLLSSHQVQPAREACQFYINTFGRDNFYLELQHHPELPAQILVNKSLIALAKELNLGLVATNDTHYLNTEDAKAHEVLLLVQTGKDIDDQGRLSMVNLDLSFIAPERITKYFQDVPEAIANTEKIADKCNLTLELGKPILPTFTVPDGTSSMVYLEKLTRKGFEERYAKDDLLAQQRLSYELGIIEKTGFADYFLIVADFINWAKNNNVFVGPGRGSAAGSIVSYCLNITDLEPIKYELLFERFLNPERISMPDIDIDFADDSRDKVIEYVKNKYGEKHVAQIITFGTMAARGAIRDTTRALGMSYNDGDRIAKLIPFGFSIGQALDQVNEIKHIYNVEPAMKNLIDMAQKLEGVARHASTHACGIVISKEPLTEYLPLQQASRGQTSITTQYPMFDIEAIGLLKMDFLGLANLTVMKNAIRIIRKIKNQDLDLKKIPLDDKKTYQLLSRAETTGVFQLESDGMKRYIKELKPSNFSDIVAMVALYRPGPIELIPDYIAGKHGKKKVTYLHPKLEPILKDTFGIAVYQEQILQIAREIAGFSLGEADILRKAVGKKIKKLLLEQKIKFIEGAVKNGLSEDSAKKIFDFVEPFASYGFNRAHATCYALIAYQTAYLKAHFPAAFMAALLTSDYGNLDRVAIEIKECERLGNKVLPPDVNQSFGEFGVVPKSENILFGLAAIKNVGVGVAEAIVEERTKNGPYHNLEDFISRLGSEAINKKTMEALAKSGALDRLAERNQVLANLDVILKFSSSLNKQRLSQQASLFGQSNQKDSLISFRLQSTDAAEKKQRLDWERELLGIYLSEHPLDEIKDSLAQVTTPITSLGDLKERQKVTIGGVITIIQKITTRNKEPMVFAHLEDTTSNIEVLVFPKVLQKDPLIWQAGNIVLVTGNKNSKDGVLKLLAEEAKIFDQQRMQHPTLVITIPTDTDKTVLIKLKELLTTSPGENPVILKIFSADGQKTINSKNKVDLNDQLTEAIAQLVGENNLKIDGEL